MTKKEVSNQDFNEAWGNEDYRNVIRKVTSQYIKVLDYDERLSCGQIALWRCLSYHDEEYGQKFTTSLWRFTEWECRRELRKKKNYSSKNISNSDKFAEAAVYPNTQVESIKQCISTMESSEQHIINEYYLQKMTMEQIGKKYGFSKEAARQRIIKAVNKLKEICNG